MNQVYLDTARLLTQVAPLVFADGVFALKGGTAINLFVRDMPRLSVGLDLVFGDHILGREEALGKINEAIKSAGERLKRRGFQTHVATVADAEREFLVSLARNGPKWDLLGIGHLQQMPGVRWKLENLGRLAKSNPKKLKAQAEDLERLLAK